MAYAHPDYLVSTAWLADHLDDPAVRILDVTPKLSSKLVNGAGEQCWNEAHIPGSYFFDVPSAKGELSDPDAALPWMWPTPEHFRATMERYGIGADTRVILVARTPREGIDSGTMWCTRAWWTMRHFGVDCAILHGGLERWQAEGRPVTDEAPEPVAPAAAPVVVKAGWEQAKASSAEVLDVVRGLADGATGVCLVDALPAESFDGSDAGYGGRPGHITGAVNVPFRSLIEAETCGFVDADTMSEVLTNAGLLDSPRVITYCGGAIAATVDAFCLALLGHEHVSVYDGSLMEWSADPTLPMTDPST